VNFQLVVTNLQFPIQVCFPYSVSDTSVTDTFTPRPVCLVACWL